MTRDELLDWMGRNDACDEATRWVLAQPAESTAQELWERCANPGHMLWLAGRGTANQGTLVRVACDIALSVQQIIPPGALRDVSARAIEAALAWADAPSDATRVAAAADAAAYAARRDICDLIRTRIPEVPL